MRRWLLGGVLAVALICGPSALRAQDYKNAPPEAELAARAEEYVLRKRVVALVLIGGTLAGGMIGMVARRRGRARLRASAAAEPPRADGER